MTVAVIVVMGVSGTGKSTVAALLARRLDCDLAEGDDLHPAANVAKMASGHPLTDADRRPWLARVAEWIREHVEAGRTGVITCSALKRAYRDVLRADHADAVLFVHLAGSRDVIAERLARRHGHYMPAALLDSQFADLQAPDPDENALTVSVELSPVEEVRQIVEALDAGIASTGQDRGAEASTHETKPV
jgi:carbohydrate kinase (thermoresistant glucokinase family)